MRQGPNGRRPRGRHHGGGAPNGGGGGNGGGNPRLMADNRPRSAASLRHQTFDSNCIDLRVRGNAWQVHEKYQALARDAQSSGDRVAAENYLQHAEHYYRIIEAINEATAAEQPPRGAPQQQPAFGQQPEIPTNYYGGAPVPQSNGNTNPPGAPDTNGNVTSMMPQAEVQQRTPPQSPFFEPHEIDENGNTLSAVARR